MMTSKLEQAFALIREALAEEYHRGEQDAIDRLVAAARGGSPAAPSASKTERGRRGAAEAFARRVLSSSECPPEGYALNDIIIRAETPEEKAINYAAVRVSLWRGEKRGWAKNIDGKWILAETEEKN
jgi:hypothetical protein